MPAPLRIILTGEEERALSELRQAQTVPYRTRDRAHMLRLKAQGLNVPAIAEIFQCQQLIVRATLRRWENEGLGSLSSVVLVEFGYFMPEACSWQSSATAP